MSSKLLNWILISFIAGQVVLTWVWNSFETEGLDLPVCEPATVYEVDWVLRCHEEVDNLEHGHELVTLDMCVTRAAWMFRSCPLEIRDDR